MMMIGSDWCLRPRRMRAAASMPSIPGSIQSRITRPKGSLPSVPVAVVEQCQALLRRADGDDRNRPAGQQRVQQFAAGLAVVHDQDRPFPHVRRVACGCGGLLRLVDTRDGR